MSDHQEGRAVTDVRAGFHSELLPTWGGKAEDILRQPKCWSSRDAIKATNTRAHESLKRPLLSTPRHIAAPRVRVALPAVPSRPPDEALVALDARIEDEEREERNMLRAQNPTQKVRDRFAALRRDPDAYHALLDRVAGARRKERRHRRKQRELAGYGAARNLVLQNKWLCADRQQCEAYWQQVDRIRGQLRHTDDAEDKIQIYEAWPTPPPETHSRERAAELQRANAAETAARLERARTRRERRAFAQELAVRQRLNRRQEQLESAEKLRRAIGVYDAAYPVLLAAKTAFTLVDLLERTQEHNASVREQHWAARVVQRCWLDRRAAAAGQQYRDAVRVIRRFMTAVMMRRQFERRQRAAKVIHWFLTQFENSNFRTVMRNYRFRVTNCQRFYRDYAACTRARMRALGVMWDRAEWELIRSERAAEAKAEAASAANRSAAAATARSRVRARGSGGSWRKGASGKMAKTPVEGRRASIDSASSGGAATVPPTAEVSAHQRVPRQVKRAVLREHLNEARRAYKVQWKEYCFARTISRAQSRLVTVEDMRSAMRAKSRKDLTTLLDTRMAVATNAAANGPCAPQMRVFLQASGTHIIDLVYAGRAAVEEQLLDALDNAGAE